MDLTWGRRGRALVAVSAIHNTLGDYQATALRKKTRKVVCKVAKSPVVPGPS